MSELDGSNYILLPCDGLQSLVCSDRSETVDCIMATVSYVFHHPAHALYIPFSTIPMVSLYIIRTNTLGNAKELTPGIR